MSSSLFTKARLRLLDEALERIHRPNRIDAAASVSPLATVIASSLHGQVHVAEHARLYRVELSGPISIARYSSLWGPGVVVSARGEPVEIGGFCSIAREVKVHGFGHDTRRISTYYIGRNVLGLPIEEEIVSRAPTVIGHDVWIGASVQIMSGVTIGTGAVIGAGSVVSADVPPYAIAVGAPAKPVRYRFEEPLIERLLESAWWTWSAEEIRAKQELFTMPLTMELLERNL
jgi:virginiamycin A acetyltransferase